MRYNYFYHLWSFSQSVSTPRQNTDRLPAGKAANINMAIPRVLALSTTEQLSQVVAQFLQKASSEAIENHGKFIIAVSGGSLPQLMCASLTAPSFASTIDFSRWEIFFADERCVALDHSDSNYRLVKEFLLDPLGPSKLSEDNIHAINPTLSPEEAAAAYQEDIAKTFQVNTDEADSVPAFDLILLGMGPDGHTCSLFPKHLLLQVLRL